MRIDRIGRSSHPVGDMTSARRYAGGRLDRRGAMLMPVNAPLRFGFAGVDRPSAGLLR